MDSNEARVREVWESVGVIEQYGGTAVYIRLGPTGRQITGITAAEAWSAAAAYTETVLREAAELQEEIALLERIREYLATNVAARPIIAYRAKARLEAIYAVHIRGIKAAALSSAPEGANKIADLTPDQQKAFAHCGCLGPCVGHVGQA